jgi:hypothetical protein
MTEEQRREIKQRLDNIDLSNLDAWFEEYVADLTSKKRRRENPYVADIARELLPHRGGQHRSWVIARLEASRKARGLPIPRTFEASVQSAYNQYCVNSLVYQKRGAPPEEGIFYAPEGKGAGYSAVDAERATAWLAARTRRG